MSELWGFAAQGGVFAILLTIVFWLFRSQLNETRKDRDFWRELALQSTELADKHARLSEAETSASLSVDIVARIETLKAQIDALMREAKDA